MVPRYVTLEEAGKLLVGDPWWFNKKPVLSWPEDAFGSFFGMPLIVPGMSRTQVHDTFDRSIWARLCNITEAHNAGA